VGRRLGLQQQGRGMRILVTGTAGFIGFHLARRLLGEGHEVVGVDGFTPYYDVSLKRARHAILKGHQQRFTEAEQMLEDGPALLALCGRVRPEAIIHLAAQAGVRYSLENPRAYIDANIVGTFNVMEAARLFETRHFMLASTSSIYGANETMPFAETDRADTPLTLYAATKKATELMSHSYSHLWKIPTTAFRFFSVYGPWGRPDMALFKFVEAMLAGRPIDVYNHGEMLRDFTYVDDLVKAIDLLMRRPPAAGGDTDDPSLSPAAPWRVVNIGGGRPWRLLDFIAEIERSLGRKAIRNDLPMQPGDVPATFADASLLERLTGYKPDTPPSVGVPAFCDWYREHYRVAA
jgi:UDP-glucuronate 4-epimerase